MGDSAQMRARRLIRRIDEAAAPLVPMLGEALVPIIVELATLAARLRAWLRARLSGLIMVLRTCGPAMARAERRRARR